MLFCDILVWQVVLLFLLWNMSLISDTGVSVRYSISDFDSNTLHDENADENLGETFDIVSAGLGIAPRLSKACRRQQVESKMCCMYERYFHRSWRCVRFKTTR